MAQSPPPQKKGWGCCGCLFAILFLLAVLIAALVGGGLYVAYDTATSPTATDVPSYDGGEDVYNRAHEKMTAFDHDLQNHVAATIHLSADEINTMIVRNPDFSKNKIRLFVSFTGTKARIQMSFPASMISYDTIKDRFVNSDMSFLLKFDPDTRMLAFDVKAVEVGTQALPDNQLPFVSGVASQALNQKLKDNPEARTIINRATAIEIKDSELVITTL